MILKRTIKRIIYNSRNFISSISVILHWIPILYKDRDWDWYFLLKIEKTKIRQMEKYFKQSDIAESNNNNVKWLHICDNLLNIMMDEDSAIKYEETPRKTESLLIFPYKSYLTKYINEKNAYRFLDNETMKFLNTSKDNAKNLFLDNLRTEKAKYLYYKIRETFTFNWWD